MEATTSLTQGAALIWMTIWLPLAYLYAALTIYAAARNWAARQLEVSPASGTDAPDPNVGRLPPGTGVVFLVVLLLFPLFADLHNQASLEQQRRA